jgi:hypothetical protein
MTVPRPNPIHAAMLTLAVSLTANAQWSVINLHPPCASESLAYGVKDGQQVGRVAMDGSYRASRWSGSAHSWVDLNPASSSYSHAFGTGGGVQVGHATFGLEHAVLWNSQGFIDLNPSGASDSVAGAVDGDQYVGRATIQFYRAILWLGTSGGYELLHPPGHEFLFSNATGIHAGVQVGRVNFSGEDQASIWHGSAATWQSLHPSGATESQAWGVHDGQQVGYARMNGIICASLWYGSAASWINLAPPGATESHAAAVNSGWQAGWATLDGADHAGVWFGTAASWQDLHDPLPAAYSSSRARGVWRNAGVAYVVGHAHHQALARDEALMWMSSSGPPPCYANCDASTVTPVITPNDFSCFIAAYAADLPSANCDGSCGEPRLTPNDFACFLQAYSAGCS